MAYDDYTGAWYADEPDQAFLAWLTAQGYPTSAASDPGLLARYQAETGGISQPGRLPDDGSISPSGRLLMPDDGSISQPHIPPPPTKPPPTKPPPKNPPPKNPSPSGPGSGGLLKPFGGRFTEPEGSRFTLGEVPAFTPPPLPEVPPWQAPDPRTLADDPGYRFRLDEGRKALEASAAGKGTLRTGGTLKDLLTYGQNYASTEYDKTVTRSRDAYALNRDTTLGLADRALSRSAAMYEPQLEGFRTGAQVGQRESENVWTRGWNTYLQDWKMWDQHQRDVFDRLRWQAEFDKDNTKPPVKPPVVPPVVPPKPWMGVGMGNSLQGWGW